MSVEGDSIGRMPVVSCCSTYGVNAGHIDYSNKSLLELVIHFCASRLKMIDLILFGSFNN